MNWKLILGLSLFGLAMAIGTAYVIPSKIEGVFWLVIFVTCAFLIARQAPRRFFLHGFLVGLTNWVWVSGAHVILRDAWIAHHAAEAAAMQAMYTSAAPLALVPILGVFGRFGLPIPGLSGVIIGALSWIASRIAAPRMSGAPGR